ncbi:hypothetical protein ZOSMA_153G00210 [Zostera marina]|uniref:LRR receptor-like serine/threonine-protein kinase n=1 Tax=Zostera marina TaxID=29655 RepID=A0A0K9PW34_ZOSMR|nr:hypothetical protein ZOSMA_153G00210 [Zostera marina]
MRYVCILFLILFLWLLGSLGDITVEAQAIELDPNEVTVLKAMATKLNIQFWNFSLNPCSGQGDWNSSIKLKSIEKNLTCNCSINNISNYCHVTSIITAILIRNLNVSKLKTVNLTGPLPEELVNLTSLTEMLVFFVFHLIGLIIFDNNRSGQSCLNFFAQHNSEFSRNTFGGTIPLSWASLPLTILGLLGNRVAGPLPEEIGTISTLQELILSGNQFTGVLPDSLGDLTNLEDFRIDGNPISGRIPSFFANWTKMERL